MSVTKVKTLKALKSKLKKELPSQISKVISSYEDFAGQPVPDDAKGFTAHHNACKSAVVHAETLLKLDGRRCFVGVVSVRRLGKNFA